MKTRFCHLTRVLVGVNMYPLWAHQFFFFIIFFHPRLAGTNSLENNVSYSIASLTWFKAL